MTERITLTIHVYDLIGTVTLDEDVLAVLSTMGWPDLIKARSADLLREMASYRRAPKLWPGYPRITIEEMNP